MKELLAKASFMGAFVVYKQIFFHIFYIYKDKLEVKIYERNLFQKRIRYRT